MNALQSFVTGLPKTIQDIAERAKASGVALDVEFSFADHSANNSGGDDGSQMMDIECHLRVTAEPIAKAA